jgi:hypothetical protein
MYVKPEGLEEWEDRVPGGEMKWERMQGYWDEGVGGQQP